MLSFLMPLVTTFVLNPMFLLGYAVCVLFPIPFVNSFILSLWTKFGASIVAGAKSLFARLTNTVETGVSTEITALGSSATGIVATSVAQSPLVVPVVTSAVVAPVATATMTAPIIAS